MSGGCEHFWRVIDPGILDETDSRDDGWEWRTG